MKTFDIMNQVFYTCHGYVDRVGLENISSEQSEQINANKECLLTKFVNFIKKLVK